MKEKLYRFLAGRYGMDDLNKFLFALEILLIVLSFFVPNVIIAILFYLVLVLYVFRSFSRNIVARSIENQRYVRIRSKITHTFKAFFRSLKDRSYYYYVCPKCSQIIRVPRNKGMITITCPSCRTQFDKKS